MAHVVPPPPAVVAAIVRKSWSFIWHNTRTLVRRPVCTLPTTASGMGALDFDLKFASLHIQWMGRLPLDDPSKCRLLALFWLDRVGLPFGGWKEILNGLKWASIWYTYFLRYYRETVVSESMRCDLSSIVLRRSRYSALVGESGDCRLHE